MKYLEILILTFCFAATSAARQACDLKASDIPALHGLKLSMSPEQAQSVFGKNLKIKIKKNGERVFFQNFIDVAPPAALDGVRALYLRFFDRRLYQIEIFYDRPSPERTLDDVTRDFSARLNLPFSSWRIKNARAVVGCGDFSIAADAILVPHVELSDENVRKKVEAARRKDEE